MSLIVDALRRAQEGARGRSPAFSGPLMRHPLAALGKDDDGLRGRRAILIIAGIVATGVIGVAAWRYSGGVFGRTASTTPARLLVLEPVAPAGAAASKPDGTAGTSIEEVRAALLAAQPLERPPEPAADGRGSDAAHEDDARAVTPQADEPPRRAKAPPAAARRTTPPRAMARASNPPPSMTSPPPSVTSRPAPSAAPPAALPPVRSAPLSSARPATPGPVVTARTVDSAVVRVHGDPGAAATEALAAGLKNQQLGQTAKAIEEYRRGIDADSRNPGLFNNLGVALRESGHLDEAIDAFKSALNIDPKYEKALNNLGVSRYQQGQYAEAIDLFNQALRINPNNVESSINLGMIYFLAQRWEEAVGAFQQALRNDPRSAEAHYNLGLLWERHGDPDKALVDYKKFVELAGPLHAALAARVSEHLRQMERPNR